jgi:hypothetical protein
LGTDTFPEWNKLTGCNQIRFFIDDRVIITKARVHDSAAGIDVYGAGQ